MIAVSCIWSRIPFHGDEEVVLARVKESGYVEWCVRDGHVVVRLRPALISLAAYARIMQWLTYHPPERVLLCYFVARHWDYEFLRTPGEAARRVRWLVEPGQFRFDYARPSMLVIVSDGRYVAIQDHDLGTDDRWGLEQTPFQMLLRKDVDLLRDAHFFDVQEGSDTVAISLQDKGTDSSGRIKLLLSKKPILELREWTAKDAQGLDTQVVLGDIAKTEDLDSDLFNPASKPRERQR